MRLVNRLNHTMNDRSRSWEADVDRRYVKNEDPSVWHITTERLLHVLCLLAVYGNSRDYGEDSNLGSGSVPCTTTVL
ncbi:hypothetical protein CRI94_05730 [Longibacter salinarum]|uniref:Uncharacterized protein n=1 Tax=Longibacter salinarum TaxID=1850348 RepID=A0A2A8D0V7_9BACT|nr:hypothetical protein CRI94_05730 [Longibacter salinarum]